MTCEQIQILLNDYVDDALSVLQTDVVNKHCATCESCSNSLESLRLQKEVLKTLAVTPVPGGFGRRVIKAAVESSQAEQGTRFGQGSVYKVAAAAMLAALVLWFGVFDDLKLDDSKLTDNAQYLVTVSDDVKTIKVAIDSERAFDAVKMRVELSDNLELAGFGSKKQISWTTGLREGVNVISLPIVGIAQGKGDITTRIHLNGKEKVMRIETRYKSPDSVLYETDMVSQG